MSVFARTSQPAHNAIKGADPCAPAAPCSLHLQDGGTACLRDAKKEMLARLSTTAHNIAIRTVARADCALQRSEPPSLRGINDAMRGMAGSRKARRNGYSYA